MSVKDKQVGGDHYKRHSIQPWDIIDEYGLDFYEGNALKYLLRDKEDRLEDLQKAIHYLEKELENLRAERMAKDPRGYKWQEVLNTGGSVTISALEDEPVPPKPHITLAAKPGSVSLAAKPGSVSLAAGSGLMADIGTPHAPSRAELHDLFREGD